MSSHSHRKIKQTIQSNIPTFNIQTFHLSLSIKSKISNSTLCTNWNVKYPRRNRKYQMTNHIIIPEWINRITYREGRGFGEYSRVIAASVFLSNWFDFLVEVCNARFDFRRFHKNLFIGGEFLRKIHLITYPSDRWQHCGIASCWYDLPLIKSEIFFQFLSYSFACTLSFSSSSAVQGFLFWK